MPFLEVDDVRLHYRFDGPERISETAPVLVLSNSLGTDLSMWDAQIPAFARHWRVLRYDGRGHGRSAVTPGPYTIERLGRDVIALLDALGIQRVHFCGLSLGGMVGMWLGIEHGERVARLILCNTAARIGPPAMWDARIEAVRQGGMAAVAAAVLSRWLTETFRERVPRSAAQLRGLLEGTPADGYIASCAAVRDMDQRDAIAAIQVPTLVIAGAQDVATPPADSHFLAEQIRGARYVELNAAHLSNIEAADRFTDEVTAFLTP